MFVQLYRKSMNYNLKKSEFYKLHLNKLIKTPDVCDATKGTPISCWPEGCCRLSSAASYLKASLAMTRVGKVCTEETEGCRQASTGLVLQSPSEKNGTMSTVMTTLARF